MLMCRNQVYRGMTRRSASRGILYTAPPSEDDPAEESTAEQTSANEEEDVVSAVEPAAADD